MKEIDLSSQVGLKPPRKKRIVKIIQVFFSYLAVNPLLPRVRSKTGNFTENKKHNPNNPL
jgi:hypothetical protein